MKNGRGKTILAWVLLIAIPLCGTCLQMCIDRLCSDMTDLLTLARETTAPLPLEQAIDLWADHQLLLTSLVTHEETDAVTQSLHKALAFLYADNTEEFYASVDEGLVDLTVVRNFDRPSIRTIF